MDGGAGDFVSGSKILEPKLEKAEIENMQSVVCRSCCRLTHCLNSRITTEGSPVWENQLSLLLANAPLPIGLPAGPISTGGQRAARHAS